MVDKYRSSDESEINRLKRRMKKFELLIMALVASDSFELGDDSDYIFHFFRKYSLRNEENPSYEDHDFYRFIDHLLYEPRSKSKQGFSSKRGNDDQILELKHNFEIKNESTKEELRSLKKAVKKLNKEQLLTKKELHSFLIYQHLGKDIKNIELNQYIPVRVYLSDDNKKDVDKVTKAVDGLLNAFGFHFSDDFPAEKGSWWKKWIAKTNKVTTQPEIADRLEKIEHALDIQGIHKPQSEVDKTRAEAISTLISSVKDIPSVAIQAGSILLVKISDANNSPSLQVKTLSIKEQIYLENNQHLLCKPKSVMRSLSKGSTEIILSTDDKKTEIDFQSTTKLLK